MKTLRHLLCFLSLALVSTIRLHATPYASGVTNKSGTIQFILNEVPTSAYVIFENGASNAIPSPVVGTNSFSLGSHTSYAIYVTKNGTGVPAEIPTASTSGQNYTNWSTPRGVAINCNPTNGDLFGLVYVANAGAGGTPSKAKGLYILNSDFSPAEGTTTSGLAASLFANSSTSGPYKLSVSADNSVWVGDYSAGNGNIFQFDPYLVDGGTQILYGLGDAAAPTVHQFELGKPLAFGSLSNGNLVVWELDDYLETSTNALGGNGGIDPNQNGYGTTYWDQAYSYVDTLGNIGEITAPGVAPAFYRYTIGAGPLPWNNPPDFGLATGLNVQDTLAEGEVAPDGKIFMAAERENYSAPVLAVYDSTGMTNLYCSQTGATSDFIASTVGPIDGGQWAAFSVKVSPDDKYVAVLGYYNYLIVMGLTNGVPDNSTATILPNTPYTDAGRQVGWDAADNVYMVSSGSAALSAFTLGTTATCVTSNDSTGLHGSFQMIIPPAEVSVLTPTSLASQNYGTPTTAMFVLTNAGNISSNVTVQFSLGGTGTNGATYTISTNGVTIPASSTYTVTIPEGQRSVDITLTPSESISEAVTLTSTLTLIGSSSYAVGAPSAGTIAIANTGPQMLGITGVQYPSLYRGITNDFASFIITRYGDTNVATYTVPASGLTVGGTAVEGVDYQGISPITIAQDTQYSIIDVTNPVSTGVYKGNESIVVSLNGGAGESLSPNSQTVTLTLIDNANPPETVLWSDPLTNASDSVNWTLTFANSNLASHVVLPVVIPNYPNYTSANPDPNSVDDFDVEFGYTLANDDVGLSPVMLSNGWTTALKMTVNKNLTYVDNHGASAGVNVYPQGKVFSGNYALRFSMNLTEGTGSTTEYNDFGINCYGTNCDWFASDLGSYGNSTTNSDGIWYWVDADTDGNGNNLGFVQVAGQALPNTGFQILNELSALPYTNVFKNPVPYDNVPGGAPADGNGRAANTWSDVEIKQFNGVITLSINNTPIVSYTNTTIYTNGEPMLGYDDPYASVGTSASAGSPGAAVYYSNIRVVSLAELMITSVSINGNQVTITFTSPDLGASPSSFAIQSANQLAEPTTFTTDSATITQSGSVYTAVVTAPAGAPTQFYRVVQTN